MTHRSAEYASNDHYTDTPDEHLVEGFDPEIALELGIPIDDETFARHQASGERVAWASQRTDRELQLLIDAAEHAAVSAREGNIKCGKCSRPDCNGCQRG